MRVPIDCTTNTSMGALVGAAYASRRVECLDAVRLARDPTRLQQAPADVLITAAALAKSLVCVIEGTGQQQRHASAFDMIDVAGRAIGAELRRRQ